MMITSPRLFSYISRNFLLNFLVLMSMLLGIVFIFDIVELMRRASGYEGISFNLILTMAALKMPDVGQMMLPFGILFSAIYTCWKLNKTHELVVIRAAGLSAWQFLAPMLFSALLIGILATTIINPISSFLLSKYGQMEIIHLNSDDNLITISRTGIWLRQPLSDGYALLHSVNFNKEFWHLSDVTVFFFDPQDQFTYRMDSAVMQLQDGHWELRDVTVNQRNTTSRHAVQKIPTDLTPQRIEESFADPETISFWKIKEHIKIMEETGFPATRLALHFQSLMAKPLLFAAMILLAATFSLRPPRFGGTTVMIALGVLVGFFIFFMESMLHAFGTSQKISVIMAAWTPAVVSLLLGTTALLHLEDG